MTRPIIVQPRGVLALFLSWVGLIVLAFLLGLHLA